MKGLAHLVVVDLDAGAGVEGVLQKDKMARVSQLP